jgi:hypothetical protein
VRLRTDRKRVSCGRQDGEKGVRWSSQQKMVFLSAVSTVTLHPAETKERDRPPLPRDIRPLTVGRSLQVLCKSSASPLRSALEWRAVRARYHSRVAQYQSGFRCHCQLRRSPRRYLAWQTANFALASKKWAADSAETSVLSVQDTDVSSP